MQKATNSCNTTTPTAIAQNWLGKGPDLTLEDVVKEGRQHEAAFKGTQQLEDLYKPQRYSE